MIAVTYQSGRLASLRLAPALPPRDPRFIPPPAEMCQLADVWKPAPLSGQWIAEPKVDGVRCLYVAGQILSREGNPLPCTDHLLPELQRLERRFGQAMVLDGEFEAGSFLQTIGVLSSRGRSDVLGRIHLFDAVPHADWVKDASTEPLTARRKLLEVALEGWEPKHLRLITQRPVANAGQVLAMANAIWAAGGEGVMLKRADSRYQRRRSTAWLKHKRKLSLAGTVVEVLHGGKAARVDIAGRRVRVSVPMGRTLSAVGMTVQVEAMEWTERMQLRQGVIVG